MLNLQYFMPSSGLAAIGLIVTVVCSAALLYALLLIIYNTTFHPLSSYPGPLLWSATRLPWTLHSLAGDLPFAISSLHQQYGPVVRIGPDELSYTSTTAWRKIYGQRYPSEFEKCLDGRGIAGPNMMRAAKVSGIVTAPHEQHGRLRRAIQPAFSERALRGQEGYLQLYTGKLVEQLRRACKEQGGRAREDIARWYALLAFDVISSLAFGQAAECLDNADQPWLQVIVQRAKSIVWYQAGLYYGFDRWMQYLVSKSTIEARKKHGELTAAKVTKRLARHNEKGEDARQDFMSYMLNNDEGGEKLGKMELVLMASSFIVAGSGTTSSALTGITYLLGRNPSAYRRLVQEIRTAFTTEEEITLDTTARLTYLRAVIDEGMRLYPPSPSTLPRFVPGKGEVIDGKWVPGGIAVGVHQLSSGRTEVNFKKAEQFVPERWLPGEEWKGDQRGASMPFSYGARSCVGLNLAYAEMRLTLAKLLWNFDFELLDDSDKWMRDQKAYLVWEKIPLMARFTPRN